MTRLLVAFTLLAPLLFAQNGEAGAPPVDVVIYGGTSAGVTAACAARARGASVLVIEPSRHLGGLSSGGLGATDIGNKAAIGGLARRFYRAVHRHYADDEHWRFERRGDYRSGRQSAGEDTMWTFEPHVAERIFRQFVTEAGVPVLYDRRIDRGRGVLKRDGLITAIRLDDGTLIRGRQFIDASYEGDLLTEAGVPFRVGRESNAGFNETLNGVQFTNARAHQFRYPVDPFVRRGDPESGLLPGVEAAPLERDGTGDHRVQAYCFRMCLTDAPQNRIPVTKPARYDAGAYELLFRYFEEGFDRLPWHRISMPNRKTDINNNHAVSTDAIGLSHRWPEADHAERARLFTAHRDYQQGLIWTLQNHSRVPEPVRRQAAPWGLCRDEYADSDHWGHQLYIREGRRMRGRLVMTEAHCRGQRVAEDPVGLAAYTMDSHHVRRVVLGGTVANEGDVQVGGFEPYPIGLDALLPLRRDARNLVVPVAMSATHIAYGSIRMEPVFMVLGESAGVVAARALKERVDVQDIDRVALRTDLLAAGQRLSWTPRTPEVDPRSLPGIVVDDDGAELTGRWTESRGARPFVGRGYRHDGARQTGDARAIFRTRVPDAGRYEVRIAYSAHANRIADARIAVLQGRARREFGVDQRVVPALPGGWHSLGVFGFDAGPARAEVTRGTGSGHLVIDAVQWIRR